VSNLYELSAKENFVPRVLRHANPHVTTDRYIKAFKAAVLGAMKNMETTLDAVKLCPPNKLGQCGKLSKVNAGEVAERLKAAVC
jgi:hypothetical protein